MKNRILNNIFWTISIGILSILMASCGGAKKDVIESENKNTSFESEKPLNMSVFLDLSDRIEKVDINDNMLQAEKDRQIVEGLIESFIEKNKTSFQTSEDVFCIVFYPSPTGGDSLAQNLSIDLKSITGPKKKAFLKFKKSYPENLKILYDGTLAEKKYFGSDIWGFFNKDKVSDLYKEDYRNVFIIISDGYVYDENNIKKEGNNYSYLLPKTLAQKDAGLLPCKISQPNFEIYFIECNPSPVTDFDQMKDVLEKWFNGMGVSNIDIRDTDQPSSTLHHLRTRIFK